MTPEKALSLPISLFLISTMSGMCSGTELSAKYEVLIQSDIVFAEVDGVKLLVDLHLPQGPENPPLVMFIHGGGWKNGNRKRCKLAWVAESGFAVASVEYRLSHEALFPAQIHDCKGALRWLRAHQTEYGIDAERVIVAGTSAGGHLYRGSRFIERKTCQFRDVCPATQSKTNAANGNGRVDVRLAQLLGQLHKMSCGSYADRSAH